MFSVKYLGAKHDLFSDAMSSSVVQKANSRLKFLYRLGIYWTKRTQQLLVMSLLQCQFDCACSFWFTGLSKRNGNKNIKLHRTSLSVFFLNLLYRTHISKEH